MSPRGDKKKDERPDASRAFGLLTQQSRDSEHPEEIALDIERAALVLESSLEGLSNTPLEPDYRPHVSALWMIAVDLRDNAGRMREVLKKPGAPEAGS